MLLHIPFIYQNDYDTQSVQNMKTFEFYVQKMKTNHAIIKNMQHCAH